MNALQPNLKFEILKNVKFLVSKSLKRWPVNLELIGQLMVLPWLWPSMLYSLCSHLSSLLRDCCKSQVCWSWAWQNVRKGSWVVLSFWAEAHESVCWLSMTLRPHTVVCSDDLKKEKKCFNLRDSVWDLKEKQQKLVLFFCQTFLNNKQVYDFFLRWWFLNWQMINQSLSQ